MPKIKIESLKKRKKYPRQKLLEALEAVKSGRSLREVSIEYGVPKTTLMSKYKGTHPIDGKSGPPPVLDKNEEKQLVNWVNQMSQLGFALTKNQMCASVQTTLKELKRKNIFSNDKPGHNWYKNFEERHNEIIDIFKKNLSSAKSAPSELSVRQWFSKIKQYLTTNELIDMEPSRIFSCNEIALIFNPVGKKIIVRKGDRSNFSFDHNHVNECAATLFTASANGNLAPPLVVFKQERIRPCMLSKLPDSWTIGKTNDGWITKESFHEYLTRVFEPWLTKNNIEKPIVIFIDANSLFPTQSLTKYCNSGKIHLLPIHPNMGHILQPLEIKFFNLLETAWRLSTEKWRTNNNRKRIKKENFSLLLSDTLKIINYIEAISEGFNSCGLYPFSPDAVDYGKKGKFKMQIVIKPKENFKQIENFQTIIDPQYSVEEVKKHLDFLEDFINDEQLKKFRKNETEDRWTGNIQDTNLFEFWRKLRKIANSKFMDECDIFTSTMVEPSGTSTENFMSIDGNFQVSQEYPQVASSNLTSWMNSNIEKLN